MRGTDALTIGQLARRTGLAVSAIRYYEIQGLIRPARNAGGQRRFLRSDIRRLSFVKIAQKFGFTLPKISALMAPLPEERTPTKRDWEAASFAPRWMHKFWRWNSCATIWMAASVVAACP